MFDKLKELVLLMIILNLFGLSIYYSSVFESLFFRFAFLLVSVMVLILFTIVYFLFFHYSCCLWALALVDVALMVVLECLDCGEVINEYCERCGGCFCARGLKVHQFGICGVKRCDK